MSRKRERNIQLEIAAANQFLKLNGVRLKVELRAGCKSLNLRGSLPSKSDPSVNRTQRIRLGGGLTPAAIEYAKSKAMELSTLLDSGRFTWDVLSNGSTGDTCAEAVEKFKRHWLESQDRPVETKEKQFRERFFNRGFSKLPMELTISVDVLRTTLYTGWKPNSAGWKIAAQNLNRLAAFCDIEAGLPGGNYSPNKVERDIPDDEQIEKAISAITAHGSNRPTTIQSRDGWQWIAGMMACYGLRDHEAFSCSVDWQIVKGEKLLICSVSDESATDTGRTKTGARVIAPLPSRWIELWGLDRTRKPAVTGSYGGVTSTQFKRMNIGFTPYDLRHAYNLRILLTTGASNLVVSKLMGHDVMTNRIYQQHIKDKQVLEGFVDGLEG